ncbi:MAG: methyltransferase family protein [Terriglobia bacterium]
MSASYSERAARWRVPLGFAFTIAFLVLSQPRPALLAIGAALALAGVALRGLAAGHLEKNEKLATAGPFRYTRNPLYLGSFILGLGFVIAASSWILGVAFVALFVAVYTPSMRQEEGFLRLKFGADYESYAGAVPMFLPAPGRRLPCRGSFAWARYKRNREYQAAIGWLAAVIFLAAKLMLR